MIAKNGIRQSSASIKIRPFFLSLICRFICSKD